MSALCYLINLNAHCILSQFQGETPYNLDMGSAKPILGQMFGTRRLNANQDGEVMLGYDLYSSALANILTDPSLSLPITVGLYAKWGSGKSFLLTKLREEMKNFTKEWVLEPTLDNSPIIFMVILHIASMLGMISWVLSYLAIDLGAHASLVAVGFALGTIVLTYSLLFGVIKFSGMGQHAAIYDVKVFLGNQFSRLKLIINVIFSHPPGPEWAGADDPYGRPIRLLFTDQTKVITSAGGQNSVTQMIGSLYDAIEDHYGIFATRLYRAFRPKPLKSSSKTKWRKMCCLPYAYIYALVSLLSILAVILLVVSLEHSVDVEDDITSITIAKDELDDDEDDEDEGRQVTIGSPLRNSSTGLLPHHPRLATNNLLKLSTAERKVLISALITIGVILGLLIVANVQTFFFCIKSLIFSQRKHLQRAVAKLDLVKSEGYLQAVKGEVQLMVNMVKTLDAFTGYQTRLVVVVDGLDSCEQSRVLSVLDAVHMLFSDEGSPFITLLAIDPHVITKAIELNIHQAFRDTSIGGMAYLRNIVHLPFYLQNAGLRKVHVAQQLAGLNHRSKSSTWLELDSADNRKMSSYDLDIVGGGGYQADRKGKGRQRRASVTSVSSVGSRYAPQGGSSQFQADITKVVATDDYMSDVNVKTMRRLMNVVNVTSRLMRAFHIDFNWNHLAIWVHITEQWPYRMSWVIFYVETAAENKYVIADSVSLWEIYMKIRCSLPSHRDLEPLLDMDRDEKKMEAILSMKQKTLTVRDLKIFLPFGINLDPYIKKVIRDEYVSLAALEGSDTGFGWFSNGNGPTEAKEPKQVAPRFVARKIAQNNQQGSKQLYPDLYQPSKTRPPNLQAKQPAPHHIFEAGSPEAPSTPVDLPSEMTLKPLSKRSVEEICFLVRQIDGIMQSRVDTYCDAIVSQNISGTVLAHCNVAELKSVLNMNFGDWEIFHLVLISLRSHERKHKKELLSFMPSDVLRQHSHHERESAPTSSAVETSNPTPSVKIATSAAETAITMEESLISGLLSKLNEEAHEDIITDEILEERRQEEGDAIYIARSQCGFMTQSVGSEDAFNALEKGNLTSSSIKGSRGSSIIALDSLPTSPSKSVTKTTQVLSNRPTSSVRVKTKHLRDRLDSVAAVPAMAADKLDDEPYAWISQTAPSTPLVGRSRSGSKAEEDSDDKFSESSAMSVGNLGDKVKKTIKQALSKMDQPSNALPPVHRATARESTSEGIFQRIRSRGGSLRSSRKNSIALSTAASIELPIFGDTEDDEEGKDNVSTSSPEQETVLPKAQESSRPHIQNLFSDNKD